MWIRIHHGIHKKNQTQIYKNTDIYFNLYFHYKEFFNVIFFDLRCLSLVKTHLKFNFPYKYSDLVPYFTNKKNFKKKQT